MLTAVVVGAVVVKAFVGAAEVDLLLSSAAVVIAVTAAADTDHKPP